MVGTVDPLIRLYDAETFQFFIGRSPKEQHKAGITDITYNGTGQLYATSSNDGSIKLWDGKADTLVHTFQMAHGNLDVCSVSFSSNGEYLLSSGNIFVRKFQTLQNVLLS